MNLRSCHCCGVTQGQADLVQDAGDNWNRFYCMKHVPWETIHRHLQEYGVRRVCLAFGFAKQAFGTPDNVKLLEGVAGAFFDTCLRALTRDIVLTISQITDPARQHGRDNLTLEQVLWRMKAQGHDPNHVQALHRQLQTVRCAATPIRTLRDKLHAHLDLEVNLSSSPRARRKPVAGAKLVQVTWGQVDDAFYEIRLFMWEAKHAPNQEQPTKPYQLHPDIPGDAAELIRRLKLLDQHGLLK